MRLYLSDQAYTSIVAETHAHIDTETGGIFLGKFESGAWYIIEVIDPGYQDILRQVAYFEYDKSYVTHLANMRARLYKKSLSLLGLWHRHPGGFDQFSATDDQTHRLYLRQNPQRGIISSLVNIDPRFRLTHYFIDSTVTHRKITDIHIGDRHIPKKFLELKFSGADALVSSHTGQKIMTGNKNEITDSNPIAAATDTAPNEVLETLLALLENELKFLETQSQYDYCYDYNEAAKAINLTLDYTGNAFDARHYPKRLKCSLFMRGPESYCRIEGAEKPYQQDFIRLHIETILNEEAG